MLPDELIDEPRQQQPCSLMVVEVDGTTSPQITEQEGVTGRASLRAPTCYKECNLVVIEKHADGKVVDRWTGGRYGPRQEFAGYAEQAGLPTMILPTPAHVKPTRIRIILVNLIDPRDMNPVAEPLH